MRDVSGNQRVDPDDVLRVINALNSNDHSTQSRGTTANSQEMHGDSSSRVFINGPVLGVRGQTLTFELRSDLSGDLTYAVDWDGDSAVDQVIQSSTGAVTVQHVYRQAGTFAMEVIGEDDQGTYTGSATSEVAVGVVSMQDGDIVVGGTERHDAIHFSQQTNGEIVVHVNGTRWGPFSPTGRLIALGQQGNDTIVASGNIDLQVQFEGGDGVDHLHGARGDDVLLGGDGTDFLFGNRGNDRLEGGEDRDHLFGHDGNDMLLGEVGDDYLHGHRGNDTLDGGVGGDRLFGHAGEDILRGDEGDDQLFGHTDSDVLIGGLGDDKLAGHSGRDLLIGGRHEDLLEGGSGDDILVGGPTSHDEEDGALREISTDWNSSRGLDIRMVNARRELNAGTVFNDATSDTLRGQGGDDWFFGDSVEASDRSSDELVNQKASLINTAVTTDASAQYDPSIAVNPADPEHVVVAYMDYSLLDTGYAGIGVAVSRDAGTTWKYSSIPIPEPFNEGAALPRAAFNNEGKVFVAFQAATFLGPKPGTTNPDVFDPVDNVIPRIFGFQSNNGIFVARSDDGGMTWNHPATVVSETYEGQKVLFHLDLTSLEIDTFRELPDGRPNPNHGNLYVAWVVLYPEGRFPGYPERGGNGDTLIATSRDGGSTWETQLEERERWIDANGDGIRQADEVFSFFATALHRFESPGGIEGGTENGLLRISMEIPLVRTSASQTSPSMLNRGSSMPEAERVSSIRTS